MSDPSLGEHCIDDGTLAAEIARSLIGDLAAVRAAIQLAIANGESAQPQTGLSHALVRLDDMTRRCRELTSGLVAARSYTAAPLRTVAAADELRPGTAVELHSTFSDSWSGGFEILGVVVGGYRIRRSSDGSVLPGPTSTADLRVVAGRARS
jgi:hypothetical protein